MDQSLDSFADISSRSPEEAIAQTVGHRVAATIRNANIRGELAAGQYLRQEELAERFRISRIPLRDALQQLEKDGFVVILPYRGAAVAPVSVAELHEIADLMVTLHSLTLRLAFPHLTPEILDRTELLGVARKQATEPLGWSRLSVEYWTTLLRPANRPLLLSMLNDLHNQGLRYTPYYFPIWKENERLQNLYVDTIRACREGNLESAVQVIECGYGLGMDQFSARLQEVIGAAGKPGQDGRTSRRGSREPKGKSSRRYPQDRKSSHS